MTADTGSAVEPVFRRPSQRVDAAPPTHVAWATPVGWTAVGIAVLAYVGLIGIGRTSLFALLVVLAVVGVTTPWFARIGSLDTSVDLPGLLRLSLGLKLLAIIPRYALREDSRDYHRAGKQLADHFRSFDFAIDPGRGIPGTGSVRYLTGLVEVLTFEDEMATFVVFALFGMVGVVLFLAAAIIALPALDVRRYALLLLFWPTMIYWPSSIGKDSVLVLGLGAVAYGVARILTGRLSGAVPAALGLTLSGLVRPHVALIAVTAAIAALILSSPRGNGRGLIIRLVIIGGLLFAGSFAANALEGVFNIDGLNPTGVARALDLANQRSAQGGSSFHAARIDGITEYPWGFITVLIRPFPQETSSIAMLLTAIEGLALAMLLALAVPRVLGAVRHLRTEAYVAYAAAFTLVFIYLFSALGNFGILARQRSMTIPLVLLFIALPTARERVQHRRSARS